ncbi:hypothetical protein B0H14DRAFT_2640764 [Mycena olivaceomarginata]|nr:hypothetical protein B0H14DRAFT_2640764 [Mycena olivaceomarginata]
MPPHPRPRCSPASSVLLELEIEVHNRGVQDSGVGVGSHRSLKLRDARSSVPLVYVLEEGEQTPGGLAQINTDTEDMPSTHTKLLSSPIYAVFVESSQTQAEKRRSTFGGAGHEKLRERATKKRKVGGRREYERGEPPGAKWGKERRGDKKRIEDERKRHTCKTISWSAYGTHVSSGGGAGLLHSYTDPRSCGMHATLRFDIAWMHSRYLRDARVKTSEGEGGKERTDGMGNARQCVMGECLALEVLELGRWGRGSAGQGRIDSGRAGAGAEKWQTDIEMERRGKEDSAIARS